ncbi:hypothetical protein ACX1C1_21580 [Paenibacillus sp. strain BS8-2]
MKSILRSKLGKNIVVLFVAIISAFTLSVSTSSATSSLPFDVNITSPSGGTASSPQICYCDDTMMLSWTQTPNLPVLLFAQYRYQVWSVDQMAYIYDSGWKNQPNSNATNVGIMVKNLPQNERLQFILEVTGFNGSSILNIAASSGTFKLLPSI